MLSNLRDIAFKDTKIQVVGIHFGLTVNYSYLQLSNKKSQLHVVDSETNISFEALKNVLQKKYPVLLSFSGKGVLNKQINKTPNYRSKVLLNVNADDFLFYEYQESKNIFISVIRESQLESQLQLFSEANYLIIDYSIGGFVAGLLKPFVSCSEIVSNDLVLHFSELELIDFQASEINESVYLGEQKLTNISAPLFATALNYYYPSDQIVYEEGFLSKNKEEKKFKQYFEVFGAIILGGFFVALLASYFLLNHYNNQQIEMNSSLSIIKDSFSEIKKLEKDRDDKQAILNESGVFTNHFLSYYVNELTVGIPSTISLSGFSIFPPTKKIKKAEKVLFKTNIIIIKGVSSSNMNFNNWYKALKKIKWISETDIINYTTNKKGNYSFEIKILIQ